MDIANELQAYLHALCRDLVSLAFRCRGLEDTAWAEAGDVLEVLRDMLHEDVGLRWSEVSQRLKRRAFASPRPGEKTRSDAPLQPPTSATPAEAATAEALPRRSLAEAASMAFSAVTAGLFWQNGSEDLAPTVVVNDATGSAEATNLVPDTETAEPQPVRFVKPLEEDLTQDEAPPEHEVCTPPVAQTKMDEVETEVTSARGPHEAEASPALPGEAPKPETRPPVPPAAPVTAPNVTAHSVTGALNPRTVTPRRVAVRVIRTGSPMMGHGTMVAPLSSPYPAMAETSGWCRTPPPGPSFLRFHPTILEGLSAHDEASMGQGKLKALQAQVPQTSLPGAEQGWQFRPLAPQAPVDHALRFDPHRHQL